MSRFTVKRVFKTTVLGFGPYCVEFSDGDIATVRSEELANLIAAAPEMYEALFKIQMLAETSELCADRVPAVTARTLLPLVRAALAKAEGKQP